MTEDPYFKVGYHVDRYYELEEDFLKVLKYMPLEIYDTPEKRKDAKSNYLADLLIRIGSNIDIVFRKRIMSGHIDKINENRTKDGKRPLAEVDLNINNYMDLGKDLKLFDLKMTVIQTRETLTPFKEFEEKKAPIWWSSYNHVKHQAVLDEANLDNVIQALAALFLLICLNKHTIKMLNYGYLCINPGNKQKVLRGMKELKHDIITKVFISPIKS